MIRTKRAYDDPEPGDGARFLVDRLWPRGIKKEDLQIEGWIKDVAPSNELRKWFGHDAEKWPEFRERYRAELEANSGALEPLRRAARQGDVTLVYAARDREHNNALVLQEFLEGQHAH
jgi:uncharacterized protein YeaO (DUF488 family)